MLKLSVLYKINTMLFLPFFFCHFLLISNLNIALKSSPFVLKFKIIIILIIFIYFFIKLIR